MVVRMILIILSVSLGYSGLAAQGGGSPPPDRLMIPASLFDRAVACIKSFEGWHSGRHHPYYQKYNVIQSNDIKSFYTHGYTLDFGCYSCDNKSALTLSKHIEKRSILSAPLRKIIVTSHFGRRTDPFTKKSRWHNGVDLKAVAGEPTYAMFAGVVAEVGFDNSRGRYVIVRSGRYAFEYYHLSRCLVSEGSLVLAGDSIGNAGSTGRSTGPHLHITLKCDGVSINPAILIDRIRRHRY